MVPDYIDATVIYEDGLNFIVGKICRVLVRRLAQLHIQVGELTSTGGCAGIRIGASAERAARISAARIRQGESSPIEAETHCNLGRVDVNSPKKINGQLDFREIRMRLDNGATFAEHLSTYT
jgi:hypothetical protein